MSKKTDTVENAEFEGTVTVVASSNIADYGAGNIEAEGTVYVDQIRENTGNIGVDLEGINFNDNYFTMTNVLTPSNPGLNEQRFYMESLFLKSRTNNGVVTTYQPTISKGDLLTHDGNTQIRLPIGVDEYILTADSKSTGGIKWNKNIANEIGAYVSKFSLIGVGSSTHVINYFYGAFIMIIYSIVKSGSSGIFFISKNKANSNNYHVSRYNSSPSSVSSGSIYSKWLEYEEIDLYKNYIEADGEYNVLNNSRFDKTVITLSGTSWVQLGGIYNVNIGAFCISIFPDNGGPVATFLIVKSIENLNASSVIKISSSPSSTSNNLRLKWASLSGIEISKTNINDNGDYNIIDNFQNVRSTSVVLNGVAPVQVPLSFFRFYQNKSFIMRIYTSLANSPKAIILMSKNDSGVSGTKTLLNAPGQNSVKLNITWEVNSLLFINKSGSAYDGTYIIDTTIIY